ncbi:RNA export factor [Martiniozyma asiatica (nom. inval.)]|nr:RNA export factor [Martiniozyma asiatica]
MSFGSRLGAFNNNTSTLGAGSTPSSQGTLAELQNDIVVPNVGDDSVSDIAFSSQAEFMAISNWDKKNRIYEITSSGQVEGRALYEHDGPILTTRFTMDGTKVISGGADKQVKLFDMASQQTQTVGMHNDAVRVVRHVSCGPQNTPCIVSGSWDKTIKYWDCRQQNPICSIDMPERVYAMDAAQKLLVVGTAERNISIINLNNPNTIFKTVQSPLKYQTRSIGCYPSGDGYAVGSIEGRCGIQYVDDIKAKQDAFSFKCQRETKPNTKEAHIYALNSIVFHPVHGTFATAGSDGSFSFWDKDSRHRLKAFPQLGATIPVTNFNRTGMLFAYALSYDWSKGHEYNNINYMNTVRLHVCKDEEVKPKRRTNK